MSFFKKLYFLKKRSHFIHKIAPYSWLDDKYWLEFFYYKTMGRRLNFSNPITYNEKLQWIKLYDRNPTYTQLSDKYCCRDYIKEKIGEKYLTPLIFWGSQPEEIPWETLPNQFVIKATHGSGWNIFCNNKEALDYNETINLLNNWLGQNFYKRFREWQYKEINPRIIIEPFFIGDQSFGLTEYQFYFFNGSLQFIQIDLDCNRNHRRVFMSNEWIKTPFFISRYPIEQGDILKPTNLEELINISEVLSNGMKFCRIDSHIIGGEIFIKEITLTPGAGYMNFVPKEYDFHFGRILDLKN